MKRALYIALIIFAACAQIKTPTGGEKDEDAPVILEMIPDNYSTNFSGNKILLSFDEYVKLNNIQDQLLVSPPLLNRPEISLKGRTVIIELEEELKENTTYTFNFGEGIIDVNEGNPLDSNKVVFSTGSFLDSLSIRGNAKRAFSNVSSSCGILLHEILSDSAIVNERPTYFAKTDESGNFTLENLRGGKYRLFAIEDLDKNYKWTENEWMAYYPETIEIIPNDSILYTLTLFREKTKKQFVKRYESKNYGRAEFVLNMQPTNLEVDVLGFEYDSIYTTTTDRRDSLVYWFSKMNILDDPEIILTDGDWIDTLSLNSFSSNSKQELPKLVTKNELIHKQDPQKPLSLEFNNPILKFDQEQIFFRLDTNVRSLEPSRTGTSEFEINIPWENSRSASLSLFPGFVTDIFGQTNDSLLLRYKVLSIEDFSELKLKVIPLENDKYILELYSENKIERQVSFTDSSEFNWNWIPAGKYKLRLLKDENENGIWDSGNYFKNEQPEPVKIFSGDLNLRANWLVEQTWNVTFE